MRTPLSFGFDRMALIGLCVALLGAGPSAAQVTVVHPDFEVFNEFDIPAGLTAELGDVVFSPDGGTAYFADDIEDPNSAVWTCPVTRDVSGNVSGFGTMTPFFSDAQIDTGLEFAPGSTTLFYRVEDVGIGQRRSDGAIEYTTIVNYDNEYGGLAFFPPSYSNAGNLICANYNDGTIHFHSVTDDLDGTFTVGGGSLYADVGLTSGPGDIEFVTSGPLAGNLLVGEYDHVDYSVAYFPLDPTTGLPAEGTNPTPIPLATGSDEVWGLSVDPVTGNIWVVEYDDGGVTLIQIRALQERVIPTAGATGLLLLGSLLGAAGALLLYWRSRTG